MIPKILRGAEGKLVWNWPIFLLGPIYLAYRKMYGPLALLTAFIVTTIFLEDLVGRSLTAANGGASIGLGIAFYRLYWKRYERAFAEASAARLGFAHVTETLKEAGGVSLFAAVAAAVVIVLLVAIGAARQ